MSSRRVCSVCCTQHAQYKCPRCHSMYCSTSCYKQHSQSCSEAFYREQATAQLKATRANPEETRHMMEVLERLHQQQQAEGDSWDNSSGTGGGSSCSSDGSSSSDSEAVDDDDDGLTAAARRRGSSMGPALKQLLKRARHAGDAFEVCPSDLSPQLIQELDALMQQGQLSHLVTPWQPWWRSDAAAALQLNAAGQRVVQDMQQLHQQAQQQAPLLQQAVQGPAGDAKVRAGGVGVASAHASKSAADDDGDDGGGGLPLPSDEPLPTLHQLAGKAHRPSLLLPWQLLQLLVAYCGVMRQYNGEPQAEGGWEAAQHLLLRAPPLIQAALADSRVTPSTTSSSSSSKDKGGLQSPQRGQQQQQQEQVTADHSPSAIVVVPDSVPAACLQLLDAAAAAESSQGRQQQQLQEQLLRAAAAVSSSGGGAPGPEARALLQVATEDALTLLRLGRSAVVLALTDSHRLMAAAKDQVKQQLQLSGGKGQQLQRQRRQLQQVRQCFRSAAQKLWYFMVWSNGQAAFVHQCLADELAREVAGQQAMGQHKTEVTLTGRDDRLSQPGPVAGLVRQPIVVVQSSSSGHKAAHVGSEQAAVPTSTGLYDLD